jgi:hypothetical protein
MINKKGLNPKKIDKILTSANDKVSNPYSSVLRYLVRKGRSRKGNPRLMPVENRYKIELRNISILY